MAVLCKKLGNTDEALRWLEEAWKRCRGTSGTHPSREDVRLQAAVAQSLARMYLHSYDLISAVEIYQEAASLHGTDTTKFVGCFLCIQWLRTFCKPVIKMHLHVTYTCDNSPNLIIKLEQELKMSLRH